MFKHRPTLAQQVTPQTAARICLALDVWCEFTHVPKNAKLGRFPLQTLLVENHSQIQTHQHRQGSERRCLVFQHLQGKTKTTLVGLRAMGPSVSKRP